MSDERERPYCGTVQHAYEVAADDRDLLVTEDDSTIRVETLEAHVGITVIDRTGDCTYSILTPDEADTLAGRLATAAAKARA